VLKSNLPVFACFKTLWCRSGFALCLVTEGLAEEYEGRIKFVEINAEEAPEPVESSLGFQSRKPLRNLMNALVTRSQEAG